MGKRCCVLIPYWNAGVSLLSSLESLDAHDHVDVLVIDDGSELRPASGVLSDHHSAVTVNLMELDRNVGIARALNAGLASALDSYEYIARLDCGDLCVDGRLATQIQYLDDHPDCYLVGSWADFVSVSGERLYTVRHPTDWKGIRHQMFVNSALVHPSVMFRTKVLSEVGLYPTDRPAAEDYAFFMKIMQAHEVANIPKVLLRYVVDPESISTTRRRQQLLSRLSILFEYFEWKPIAIYGICRATVQLLTTRGLSVLVRRLSEALRR